MKKKAVTIIFAITFFATSLFSQTVNEKIDKQIKDPKARENSGKADVYIQKKKIYDSAAIIKTNESPVTNNKRKKYCKKRFKS